MNCHATRYRNPLPHFSYKLRRNLQSESSVFNRLSTKSSSDKMKLTVFALLAFACLASVVCCQEETSAAPASAMDQVKDAIAKYAGGRRRRQAEEATAETAEQPSEDTAEGEPSEDGESTEGESSGEGEEIANEEGDSNEEGEMPDAETEAPVEESSEAPAADPADQVKTVLG
jgi:hypothetical protein